VSPGKTGTLLLRATRRTASDAGMVRLFDVGSRPGSDRMGTKSMLSAVVVTAALLGCASSPPIKQGFDPKYDQIDCKASADCGVDIVVNRACAAFSNCLDVKTGAFVVISDGATPKITWTLKEVDADDFEFDAPIEFLNNAGDFACDVAEANKHPKQVTCTKLKSSKDFQIYKYKITARPFKGLHFNVAPLDPWVINK
jgi:hypothetical protein